LRTTGKQRAGTLPGGTTSRGFRPDQSGNRGGRPRAVSTIAVSIREQTPNGREVADFMLSVPRDPRRKVGDRMHAAMWLADRGFGRPAQAAEPLMPATDGPRRIVLEWENSPA